CSLRHYRTEAVWEAGWIPSSFGSSSVLQENNMKDHGAKWRIVGWAVAGQLALLTSLAVAPTDSDAGILRNVLASIGLSKRPATNSAEAAAQGLPRHGFACCNLHYSKDWISDGNYAELPMIPVGTPIEVQSYGKNRAYVVIDGKPMRLGHDYGRDQE